MPDPDLETRDGGQLSRPLDNGEPGLQKNFFRPFGPQFGLKVRGGVGTPGPLPWIRQCLLMDYLYTNLVSLKIETDGFLFSKIYKKILYTWANKIYKSEFMILFGDKGALSL